MQSSVSILSRLRAAMVSDKAHVSSGFLSYYGLF